jgi:hypothetical protein
LPGEQESDWERLAWAVSDEQFPGASRLQPGEGVLAIAADECPPMAHFPAPGLEREGHLRERVPIIFQRGTQLFLHLVHGRQRRRGKHK